MISKIMLLINIIVLVALYFINHVTTPIEFSAILISPFYIAFVFLPVVFFKINHVYDLYYTTLSRYKTFNSFLKQQMYIILKCCFWTTICFVMVPILCYLLLLQKMTSAYLLFCISISIRYFFVSNFILFFNLILRLYFKILQKNRQYFNVIALSIFPIFIISYEFLQNFGVPFVAYFLNIGVVVLYEKQTLVTIFFDNFQLLNYYILLLICVTQLFLKRIEVCYGAIIE